MAAEDIVIYNGVPMCRDYAEDLEAIQACTHYRGHGGLFPRVRLGDESGIRGYHQGRTLCRCCNAAVGQFHSLLCEGEECPRCGYQVMSCHCEFFTEDAVPAEQSVALDRAGMTVFRETSRSLPPARQVNADGGPGVQVHCADCEKSRDPGGNRRTMVVEPAKGAQSQPLPLR